MLSITRRTLTDEEKGRLDRELERVSKRPVAVVAYFVTLPLGWSGLMFALLLALRVPAEVAATIGLASGLGLGALLFLRERRKVRTRSEEDAAVRRRDLEGGAAQVWEFEVTRVWEVRNLEEYGPSYLFQVDEDTLVYASSPAFLNEAAGRFPTRKVALHRLPHSKAILALGIAGESVRAEATTLTLPELPVQPSTQSELLWRNTLQPATKAKLWPETAPPLS